MRLALREGRNKLKDGNGGASMVFFKKALMISKQGGDKCASGPTRFRLPLLFWGFFLGLLLLFGGIFLGAPLEYWPSAAPFVGALLECWEGSERKREKTREESEEDKLNQRN